MGNLLYGLVWLFWGSVILGIPALFIWSMIIVARDRSDFDINDFR